jgi:hypothetical protein
MIAEYQVDKLRSGVSEKIGGKYIYESEAGKKGSTHMLPNIDCGKAEILALLEV